MHRYYLIKLPVTLEPGEINPHDTAHKALCVKACMEAKPVGEVNAMARIEYHPGIGWRFNGQTIALWATEVKP